ncbi:MAG: hypothetical protein Q4F11_10510 [Eubacteriales bacterium]|nr:hypothetical protein [Eubacteriales bacterium]
MEICLNENTALLDRAVFNNIQINGFLNMEELLHRGIVEYNPHCKVNYITELGQEFTRLNIEGAGSIQKLFASSILKGNVRMDYCNLHTSPVKEETGNLYCYTVQQYQDHLRQIQDDLICEYGIDTDFSGVSLKELEINRTFKLDGDFYDYYRVLRLLITNLPGKDFKFFHYAEEKENGISDINTYYGRTTKQVKPGRKYAELKIYNKSKQLENVIILDGSYMRVEIKLVGTERIKRALGSNKLSELTDEGINTYYRKQVQKWLVKPYEKWKKERDRYLLKLMKEQYIKNERHWQVDTLRILQNMEIENKYKPVLLDVSELMDLVNEVIPDKMKRYRAKYTLRKQAEKYESAFCHGDHNRVTEIIKKVSS